MTYHSMNIKLDDFIHSVGAYHIDSRNLSDRTVRAFVKLVREKAGPIRDGSYSFKLAKAFEDTCEELGLFSLEN